MTLILSWVKKFMSFCVCPSPTSATQHYHSPDKCKSLWLIRLIQFFCLWQLFINISLWRDQLHFCYWNSSSELCAKCLSTFLNLVCKRSELTGTKFQDVCVWEAEEKLDTFFWTELTLQFRLSFSLWLSSRGHHDNWDSLSKTQPYLEWEVPHHPNWKRDFSGYQDNSLAFPHWPCLFPQKKQDQCKTFLPTDL